MKIHGSIEGRYGPGILGDKHVVSMNENSWLYWRTTRVGQESTLYFAFPWMKIHGSIEGNHSSRDTSPSAQVSMNENSWLYWSASNGTLLYAWIQFPWMKIHGSIEATAPASTENHPLSCFHEWKFMALLKHLSWRLESQCNFQFPWMKIHGSIEAFFVAAAFSALYCVSMNENSWLYWSMTNPVSILSRYWRFHEWKFMALLKPHHLHGSGRGVYCFHEWKFMALLKRVHSSLHEVIKPVFPWMKIHGSIEAGDVRKNCVQIVLVSMNENSWLYWSQTLDRNDLEYLEVSMNENSWLYWSPLYSNPIRIPPTFPWMKIHGSIEALLMVSPRIPDRHVSMNENSWLYWSRIPESSSSLVNLCFHEWKFMALLKLHITCYMRQSHSKFPWMKIHGSIEATPSPGRELSRHSGFHEWKFMALLKRCCIALGGPYIA